MKLQLGSDLHLEFDNQHGEPFRIPNAGSDVLILSGDICVAEHFTRGEASPYQALAQAYRNFFAYCSDNFNQVIYIPGNHEHYRSKLSETYNTIGEQLQTFSNIAWLDGEHIDYAGYRFFGATLWTNLNNGCPMTSMTLQKGMNDYRLIGDPAHTYKAIIPERTASIHAETLKKIKASFDGVDKAIMVSHHAPSLQSIDKVRYGNDHYMNGGYASNLEEFILSIPQIKLWTHGHMHASFDYHVGDTRIVCNPRGYHGENPYFDPNKIIEV